MSFLMRIYKGFIDPHLFLMISFIVMALSIAQFGFQTLSNIAVTKHEQFINKDIDKPEVFLNIKLLSKKKFLNALKTKENNKSLSLNTKTAQKTKLLKSIELALPQSLRNKASNYLPFILSHSIKHDLDPIWIISIIWSESHFKAGAKSHVGARGLMQLMPRTYIYLKDKYSKDYSRAYQNISDPFENIKFGILYFKSLVSSFKGNYKLATIAYNMGPTFVHRNKKRSSFGRKHQYFQRVFKRYSLILKSVKL